MPRQSKLPLLNGHFKGTKLITRDGLKEMVKSYRENLDNNETRSCLLALADIKSLIDYYSDRSNLDQEAAIDGFRVYFFRQEAGKEYSPYEQKILNVGSKGQMSIIMVPVHNFKDTWKDNKRTLYCDDMFNKNNECLAIWPGGEATGLCPTNCGGSIDDDN
jgi:hypothetical protein